MGTKVLTIEKGTHAHRCESCFVKDGVTVLWVHDDSHAGEITCVKVDAGHTCPRCGGKSWVKFILPKANLPQRQAQQQPQQYVQVLLLTEVLQYMIYAVLLLALLVVFNLTIGKKGGGGVAGL